MFRNRNIAVILLVIVGVMGMAFTSTAQDTLNYGETIQGTAEGADLTYTLSAGSGDVIALVLESNDFDPTLTLLDSSGEQVAFNDDTIGLNSQIAYSVPEEGDYTVIVSSFDGEPQGNFSLIVIGGACILLDQTAAGEVIDYFWTIPEGETILVDLQSEAFDPLITVSNSSEEELASDDDGGDGLNSRLAFTAPADDIYAVTVTRFGEQTPEGDYRLIVSGAEVIEDSVSETTEYTTFEGVAGGTITIALNSEDFDPLIRILDANGTEVASDDDGGNGLNSLLEFTPTEDGIYTIVVDSFNGAPEGEFQLSASFPCAIEDEIVTGTSDTSTTSDQSSSDSSDATSDAFLAGMNVMDMGTIAVAESVNVTAEGTIDIYSITMNEGQTVTINLSSDDFDTFLLVAADTSASEPLGFNDDIDYPENTNSELAFTAPSAGTYIIIASSLSGEATGSYTLSVQ